MLPKKPAPAPVFNYRKRQRQAVFADPENHPAPTRSACDLRRVAAAHCDGSTAQSPHAAFSSTNRGMPRRSTEGELPSAGRRPIASTAGEPRTRRGKGSSWGGGSPATALSQPKEWSNDRLSMRLGTHGPSSGYMDLCQPCEYPKLIMNIEDRPTAVPQQPNTTLCKKMAGSGQVGEAGAGSDQTLRVLTLPTAHLKRVFHLHVDKMPPLVFVVFGIVDSATVSDRATSGKSFVLRDETGSITCVFCEIDRQVPRLHRGQWYRVVGVMKPTWEAMQCLSLRPVKVEERLAARAVMSLCISLLNNLLCNVMEQ